MWKTHATNNNKDKTYVDTCFLKCYNMPNNTFKIFKQFTQTIQACVTMSKSYFLNV